MPNSPRWLKSRLSILAFFLPVAAFSLRAQTVTPADAGTDAGAGPAPAANPASPAIVNLRAALGQVSSALSSLRIAHWKAPSDLRDATTEDVGSIQRDLAVTLPPMLDQAQGSGANLLAPSFAAFRNIDALYDVLLRVTEVATLTGSSSEASQLENARGALESARAQLAGSLLQSMSAQDTQLAELRARIVAAPAQTTAAPAKTVVDDGPEPAPKHRKKKTPPAPQ